MQHPVIDNEFSFVFYLVEGKGKLQPFAGNLVKDHFCMRSDTTTGTTGGWPAGSYCIYQQGDACPTGQLEKKQQMKGQIKNIYSGRPTFLSKPRGQGQK